MNLAERLAEKRPERLPEWKRRAEEYAKKHGRWFAVKDTTPRPQ